MIRETALWLEKQPDLARATSTAAAAAQGVSLLVFQRALREQGTKYMALLQEERVRRIQEAMAGPSPPALRMLAPLVGISSAHSFSGWYRYTFGEPWRIAAANNRIGRKMK